MAVPGILTRIIRQAANAPIFFTTYHIVGSYETDPKAGKISDSSPVGIALIGTREGDTVTVSGAREQTMRILSVKRAKE